MPNYVMNKTAQANGDHEVHNESTCTRLPAASSRLALGLFYSCSDAVTKAKNLGYKADGCFYCSYSCHKS